MRRGYRHRILGRGQPMDRSFLATGFVVAALALDGAKEAEARS